MTEEYENERNVYLLKHRDTPSVAFEYERWLAERNEKPAASIKRQRAVISIPEFPDN